MEFDKAMAGNYSLGPKDKWVLLGVFYITKASIFMVLFFVWHNEEIQMQV